MAGGLCKEITKKGKRKGREKEVTEEGKKETEAKGATITAPRQAESAGGRSRGRRASMGKERKRITEEKCFTASDYHVETWRNTLTYAGPMLVFAQSEILRFSEAPSCT